MLEPADAKQKLILWVWQATRYIFIYQLSTGIFQSKVTLVRYTSATEVPGVRNFFLLLRVKEGYTVCTLHSVFTYLFKFQLLRIKNLVLTLC
jgi:CRISPR/Cas system-associated endonuclease/helicase Cas3